MAKKRKQYSNDFKFKVALDAIRGVKTISQLASDYNLHPTQIRNWKKQLLREGSAVFTRPNSQAKHDREAEETELHEQLEHLKMELEWLKKKSAKFD